MTSKLIFLTCSIHNGKLVFDTTEQYEAEKQKKGWIIKGLAIGFPQRKEFYLDNKEYNVVWSNHCNGYYTSYIWCQKINLKTAKQNCINELLKQKSKMKKLVLQKKQNYLDYKNSIDIFYKNYP